MTHIQPTAEGYTSQSEWIYELYGILERPNNRQRNENKNGDKS